MYMPFAHTDFIFPMIGEELGARATLSVVLIFVLILVIVIGGVFVMEATSVILQVLSFKIRGKRLFRMSPIHHHFELKGWHESQVITRFWIRS